MNTQVQFQLFAPEPTLIVGGKFLVRPIHEMKTFELKAVGVEPEIVGGAEGVLVELLFGAAIVFSSFG